MEKMTFNDKIMKLIGYSYVVNKNTDEIHDLNNVHTNCKLLIMSKKNKKYITRKTADKLLSETSHDGCRWCMKDRNNG